MSRSRARLVGVMLVLAAAFAALAAQESVEPRIRRIENGLVPPVVIAGQPIKTRSLLDRMRALEIPAVSIAVFDNGRIAWLHAWGFADVAAARRATPSTRFQAASISKPVSAVAALALVTRGKLSLDGAINDALHSWKLPDNEFTAKQRVTLKHLLTHSGGVTVSGFRGYAQGEEIPTLRQVLDGVKPANSLPIRVDIPVGSRFRYAGGGYEIVQLAIEEAERKTFASVMRELVLDPFGMTHSTFEQPIPPAIATHAATGYRHGGQAVRGRWHTYPEQAAAGLWTTPEDLARFALELQQIAAGGSQKVISRDLAAMMLRQQFDQYGLGVAVTGEGAEARFSHSGGNEGFRCFLVGYRDVGAGVAIMTNSDRGGDIIQDVVRAVAREYGWRGLDPIVRTLGTADPGTYADFVGLYELAIRSPPLIIRVEQEGSRLFGGSLPSRAELLPENATTFFATNSDFRIEFVRDADGKVTSARVWQGGVERSAAKIQ